MPVMRLRDTAGERIKSRGATFFEFEMLTTNC
jgi:hypothetical protein